MYPVVLNVKNKVCTIIGGGNGAYLQARRLHEEDALLVIIAPDILDERLYELPIAHIEKSYDPWLVPESSFLVLAATNDSSVNEQIVRDARQNGRLVLNLEDSQESDFNICAYQELDAIAFSVMSKIAVPGFSAALCKQLAKDYARFDQAVAFASKLRKLLLEQYPVQAKQLIYMLSEPEVIQILIDHGFDAYKKKIEQTFSYYL